MEPIRLAPSLFLLESVGQREDRDVLMPMCEKTVVNNTIIYFRYHRPQLPNPFTRLPSNPERFCPNLQQRNPCTFLVTQLRLNDTDGSRTTSPALPHSQRLLMSQLESAQICSSISSFRSICQYMKRGSVTYYTKLWNALLLGRP